MTQTQQPMVRYNQALKSIVTVTPEQQEIINRIHALKALAAQSKGK